MVFPSFVYSQSLATKEYEDRLRKEEKEVLEQLKVLNVEKSRLQGEAASLKRDIAILDSQINVAKLKIKASNITIELLSKDIGNKSSTISELEDKIYKSQESLSGLIRKTNEKDLISVVEIILSSAKFADFFGEVGDYKTVSNALKVMLDDVRVYKSTTESEKENLEIKKDKAADARKIIESEKRIIERAQAEKNKLLSITSGQEKAYQGVIADKERRVAQIRAALFQLRDADGIPFGNAYDYAVTASKNTGVRPAFLLAIFQQESDLGKNVGNCYLKNATTGDGVGANTGTFFSGVMHATRDVPLFIKITTALGFDPFTTRVSCPQSYGYGGAMGPAQFIPSTWNIFASKVAKALGTSLSNPWDPEHAFMASSLFLADLGAGLQTYSAEQDAACRYYSGARCGVRPGSTTYGNQVMAKAQNIQECMIDPILGKSSGC